jgi:hypothetical protein
VQQWDGQEYHGDPEVDQADVQHTLAGECLQGAESGGDEGGDPGGDIEYPLRAGDGVGPMLVTRRWPALEALTV